jgi:hypothetical protein
MEVGLRQGQPGGAPAGSITGKTQPQLHVFFLSNGPGREGRVAAGGEMGQHGPFHRGAQVGVSVVQASGGGDAFFVVGAGFQCQRRLARRR